MWTNDHIYPNTDDQGQRAGSKAQGDCIFYNQSNNFKEHKKARFLGRAFCIKDIIPLLHNKPRLGDDEQWQR